MFLQNLLHQRWNGERITFAPVPMLRAPTFLSHFVIKRQFKPLDRVNFPITLKCESCVFGLTFLDFRRQLFSPFVDFPNTSATFGNLFLSSFVHQEHASRPRDRNYTTHHDTTTITHYTSIRIELGFEPTGAVGRPEPANPAGF